MVDDTRDCRNNEKGVANKGDKNGDTDGLETTPTCVGDVCTKERNNVDPDA